SSSASASRVTYPARVQRLCAPASTSTLIGLSRPCITRPIAPDRAPRNERATECGTYPNAVATDRIRSRVSSRTRTFGSSFSTREAIAGETPASFATSRNVGWPRGYMAARYRDDGVDTRPSCHYCPEKSIVQQVWAQLAAGEPAHGHHTRASTPHAPQGDPAARSPSDERL